MASDNDDGALGYIFLDVISCGLGGALLLGIILAMPKELQTVPVAASPYLVVSIKVTDQEDQKPDFEALPNIWIKPPGVERGFDLPLEQFDLKAGRVRRGAEVLSKPFENGLDYNKVFPIGFFRHGEGVAELQAYKDKSWVPVYDLFVNEPLAGDWEFRVRYQNRRDILAFVGTGKAPPPITVRAVAYTADTSRDMPSKGVSVKYSDLSEHTNQQPYGLKLRVAAGKTKSSSK